VATLSTRKSIRRRAGRLTGDLLLCTATSSSTTTTFIDVLNLNHENSIFRNRQGIFSGGTSANLGRVVRVESNDKSTQTLTFTPAAASIPAVGDELELWNERDEGVTPSTVNEMISDAITDLGDFAIQPVTSDSVSFDFDSHIIAIDDLEVDESTDGVNWEAITGVDWRDGDDETFAWNKVDSADLEIDRYARTITIKGRHRRLLDGSLVRVRGANTATALSVDSDTTAVNFEWLTHQVAAGIIRHRMERAHNAKELEPRLMELQNKADLLRGRVSLKLKGRFWRLT
jgi:hypothetical protein